MKIKIIAFLLIAILLVGCSITPANTTPEETAQPSEQIQTTKPLPTPEVETEPEEQLKHIGLLLPMELQYFHNSYLEQIMSDLYNIEYIIEDTGVENFNALLMANDTSFDVYYDSSYWSAGYYRIREGYMYDLSKDSRINAQFEAMYPVVEKACTYDNQKFGFPYQLQSNMVIVVDNAKANYAEYEIGETFTVQDILDFDDAWIDNGFMPGTSTIIDRDMLVRYFFYSLLLPEFDEASHSINFDIVDIEKCKALYDELDTRGLIVENIAVVEYRDYPLFMMANTYDSPTKTFVPFYVDQEEIDEKGNLMMISWFIVNPSTNNINNALDFIYDYGEMSKIELVSWDTDDISQCITLEPIYSDMLTYLSNEYGKMPVSKYNQSTLDKFGKFYENRDFRFSIRTGETGTIFKSYFADEIDADTARREMQEAMDLVAGENNLG